MCHRFNPIEKFNGWLKSALAVDIDSGKASRLDIWEAVHSAIDRRAEGMLERCQNWIDYLFDDRRVGGRYALTLTPNPKPPTPETPKP